MTSILLCREWAMLVAKLRPDSRFCDYRAVLVSVIIIV